MQHKRRLLKIECQSKSKVEENSLQLIKHLQLICCRFFFFFQAEDGIRDLTVTGVQTCALPICGVAAALSVRGLRRRSNFYVPVLIIALGYLAAALALGLAGNWSVAEIGLRGVWGAANGLGAAGLSCFLLPLAESVTGITTDLTPLERSARSRPLVRRP